MDTSLGPSAPAEPVPGRPRHVLVVCTANVCRSPVAQRLLQRSLDGLTTDADTSWVVRSAGTADVRAAPDRRTWRAARAVGLVELEQHVPRVLDRAIVSTDGADLIITMERAHLRHVVALDRSSWERTFVLKELVRRAAALPAEAAGGDFEQWRSALGCGRDVRALLGADPADDVGDPYGRPQRAHDAMVDELVRLVGELERLGPWWGDRPGRHGGSSLG